LGFITAILYSFLPVLSSEFPSFLPDIHCLRPLEVRSLVSRGFARFPKDYFASYYIRVSDIFQFHGSKSYNNGTT
jgi:hypothetical protein